MESLPSVLFTYPSPHASPPQMHPLNCASSDPLSACEHRKQQRRFLVPSTGPPPTIAAPMPQPLTFPGGSETGIPLPGPLVGHLHAYPRKDGI